MQDRNIWVTEHHESDWCDWGSHQMEMQRIWILEILPVSWICSSCIKKALSQVEESNGNASE